MVGKALFLYTFCRKKVALLDSYDNDWLFLDDDLFCVLVDEYLSDCKELEALKRERATKRTEDAD